MDLRAFTNSVVGVPFLEKGRTRAGWDCWGLCVSAYADVFGLHLPSYAAEYRNAKPHRELADLILAERAAWINVRIPNAGDVVLFKIHGHPVHCGVVLDRRDMLHVHAGTDTCVDRYRGLAWGARLDGFWRHELLA